MGNSDSGSSQPDPGAQERPKAAGIADTSGQDIALAPASTRRRWVVAASVALVLLVAAVVLGPSISRWSQAEASISRERLRVATVHYGDLVRDVSVEGRVVAAVSPTLFAPADGTVTLLVESGTQVKVGDELARIESPELQNRLEQEQATLESARIDLERQDITNKQLKLESQKEVDMADVTLTAAKRELRRVKLAFGKGAVPEVDVEKGEDDVKSAELAHAHAVKDMALDVERQNFELKTRELQVQRQELLVNDLRRQVDDLSITSPVTGIVGNLQVDQKAALTRNQAVMTVVDLTAFQVETDVPESYADDLGLGMAAEVHVGNEVYRAEVISVSPEIVDNQVTTRVRFIDDPPGLRQNQRLTTRILLENKPHVLMVERGQFLESGGGRVAYLLDDDIARRVPIEVGARSLNGVEILNGLDDGDTIITSSIDTFDQAETVLVTN